MAEAVSKIETSVQHRYKAISALANQIDIHMKNSPSNDSLFQTKPLVLRKRLKDRCSRALLSNEFTFPQLDKIEDILWNLGFYRLIQKCRNSPEIQGDTPLQIGYRTHITAGIGFYISLLAKMTDTHNITTASFLDWNRYQEDSTICKNTDKQYEVYIYKCLIHLGDLSRYQQVFTHNYDVTKRYYYQAIILNPSLGHAYNQIAGMYPGINYNLDSVYFYLRALACTDSIVALSEVNIKVIYDKNRMQLDIVNALPPCVNASEYEHNERLLQRFIHGFLRLQEIFSPLHSSEQNGQDMEYMCSRLLKDFEECLAIDELCSTSKDSFDNEGILTSIVGGDPLFKICIISILTSHILRAHGSTHTPAATSFAVAIFSLIIQCCITRVRKIILSPLSTERGEPQFSLTAIQLLSKEIERLNNDSSIVLVDNISPDATQSPHDIEHKTSTPILPQNINKYGPDSDNDICINKRSMSSSKRVSRVQRVRIARDNDDDLSEGNVSDSILSSRSDSSSSSGFEILGTDHSSDEDDTSCDKPQNNTQIVLNNVSDESPESIMTTQDLKDTSELESADLNSPKLTPLETRTESISFEEPIETAKIILAAKFSMEDIEIPTATIKPDNTVYISDNLTKLCRDIQDESTLCAIRAFSIWLHNNPVILATCAQSSAILWSHLAALLNFLPSTSEFIQEGVFPEYKSSPDSFSLARDWSQSHPLLEDKLLYGFLQDEQLSNLKNMFISSTPEEEQCLTRLIYLRKFGLLMAANKLAPAFTFDPLTQLFVGPAQKELQNAKLAEEIKLIEQTQAREKQNNLMRALANQRLKGQVDMLRAQQQHLKDNLLPFILIPDALSLCNQLNTLKRLVNSKKFTLIIANVTLRILDEMKGQKKNFHVRQALRYIEHEFESSDQTVRPQALNVQVKSAGRDKRRQLSNPTVACISELFDVGFKHAEIESRMSSEAVCLLFDESIIQNFIAPGSRTYHQFAPVLETAGEAGVAWMSVSEFFYKWMAIKKD
ncbi:Protein SMG5 [Oopsacas minuta]|uniref:Protein SMG5 n=1 Tax=Oopsacas minuta TaxID=111878 RepID=A0AAV7K1V9_9METZ|nr:Protein SMG5 [Oopsacas minuta]